jgi:hypothetical protein
MWLVFFRLMKKNLVSLANTGECLWAKKVGR